VSARDVEDRLHHCANCYRTFDAGERFLWCTDCGTALCERCADGHEGMNVTKIAGTWTARLLRVVEWIRRGFRS